MKQRQWERQLGLDFYMVEDRDGSSGAYLIVT